MPDTFTANMIGVVCMMIARYFLDHNEPFGDGNVGSDPDA